jgi:amino acid permease
MNVKRILLILAALAVVLFGVFKFIIYNTKKNSAEATANYDNNGTKLEVKYCSPSKKGRDIFGTLIPYGQVWRTGANEPTTFETNKNLSIAGQNLPAGKYSLWTIPEQNSWTVIFDKKMYGWGEDFSSKASHDGSQVALKTVVPTSSIEGVQENFKVEFVKDSLLNMNLLWDKTKVSVPIAAQ